MAEMFSLDLGIKVEMANVAFEPLNDMSLVCFYTSGHLSMCPPGAPVTPALCSSSSFWSSGLCISVPRSEMLLPSDSLLNVNTSGKY